MKWHESLRSEPKNGATAEEIDLFLATVFAPLTEFEINELHEEHKSIAYDGCFDPLFDPSKWALPRNEFPLEYLDFLRWSNGGYFEGVNRDLDPLFATNEVREYLLAYSIPHWMPQTSPIGFDGGGGFYLFDMRCTEKTAEYPILWAHAGNLSFEDAEVIANSFHQFIESTLGD